MRATLATCFLVLTSTSALSGGLIGDFLKEIAPNVGNSVDRLHRPADELGQLGDESPPLSQNITNLCKENPSLEQCRFIFGPGLDAKSINSVQR